VSDGHCWHTTGGGYATAMPDDTRSGADYVRCCWCGVYGVRPWQDKLVPAGHGPYVVIDHQVFDPVRTTAPPVCPRPALLAEKLPE
jgi:hypothetical protein